MNELSIRQLHERDTSSATQVIREAFGTVADEFGLTIDNCPTHGAFATDDLMSEQMSDGLMLFGAFIDDRLVGIVGIRPLDEQESSIEKLAVLPNYRHRGIGDQLMTFACEQIRCAGAKSVIIGIIDENRVLKRWYEAQGFVETDIKRVPHLPFTVCLMRKSV